MKIQPTNISFRNYQFTHDHASMVKHGHLHGHFFAAIDRIKQHDHADHATLTLYMYFPVNKNHAWNQHGHMVMYNIYSIMAGKGDHVSDHDMTMYILRYDHELSIDELSELKSSAKTQSRRCCYASR
jgi:hypothetical protein